MYPEQSRKRRLALTRFRKDYFRSKLAEESVIDCVEKNGVWEPVPGRRFPRSPWPARALAGAAAAASGYGLFRAAQDAANFRRRGNIRRSEKTAAFHGITAALRDFSRPGRLKNLARKNATGIFGAATGMLGGAYLGNMAYKNALPPVRALPQLEQEPYVSAANAWQAQETDGY